MEEHLLVFICKAHGFRNATASRPRILIWLIAKCSWNGNYV